MITPDAEPNQMPILNYTTTIATAKTVGEVQAALAEAGADQVTVVYAAGQPIGLAFALATDSGDRIFRLPVDILGVQNVLRAQKVTSRYLTDEHAAKVAWRIMKDWVEAQVALIQAGMAALDQVMLPYLEVSTNRSLYAVYQERQQVDALTG